jgi:uncharacterized damage-inducible protein DinB
MNNQMINSYNSLFRYYKQLGDRSLARLKEDDIHWQFNEESNSIAIIVNHLHGNMLSRWTDFFTSDGEKEWRERDKEFVRTIESKEKLLEKWEAGWNCLFSTLHTLKDEDLQSTVYIRNMGHTVSEAIQRQLAHYAYHIGQIVYLARMLQGSNWTSLSIPKGESVDYNNKKFSEPNRNEHFTEDFLKKNKPG